MRPRRVIAPTLLGLLCLTTWLPSRHAAQAVEPAASSAYRCRTFKQPLDGDTVLDTADRTSEVGQWVAEHTPQGWRVQGVDFEVSPKPGGFGQGYVQVCLTR